MAHAEKRIAKNKAEYDRDTICKATKTDASRYARRVLAPRAIAESVTG